MAINRVSFSSNFLLIRNNLLKSQTQYEDSIIPTLTGRKINNLSDNTASTARIFNLRNEVKQIEQYQRNLTSAKLKLNHTEVELNQANGILLELRDVALQANAGTGNTTIMQNYADIVATHKEHFLELANSKFQDKYLFAGTATDTQPFVDTGGVVSFNSAGGANTNAINTQATSSLQIRTNLNGNEVFTGSIATATGTSLATSLKDSDSAPLEIEAGDVITISGSVGGVAMAGQTLTVTSTTDLDDIATAIQTALRSVADGDLTETAAVQGDGSIRVTSDGANAITNLALSISGKTDFNTAFTYATNIAGGGNTADSDTLQTGTGEDIFDVFDDLEAAIRAQDSTALSRSIRRIDNALNQMNQAIVDVGLKFQQIESFEDMHTNDILRFTEDLSETQDVSIDVAISDMVAKETALRLVFNTSSRVLSTTSQLQLNF